MKKIIYIAILSIIGLCSCTKERIEMDKEDRKASVYHYLKEIMPNPNADGRAFVQSYSTVRSFSPNPRFSVTSTIKGDRDPLKIRIGENSIRFKDPYYSPTADKTGSNYADGVEHVSKIFGGTFNVTFSLDKDLTLIPVNLGPKTASRHASKAGSVIHIPHVIRPKFLRLDDGKVTVNTQIVWNADEQNKKGVVIGLGYDPSSQQDNRVATQNPRDLFKGIRTKDDGSYTITAQDLGKFPQNAEIRFHVVRVGNGIATNDRGERYQLAGMTLNTGSFTIKK